MTQSTLQTQSRIPSNSPRSSTTRPLRQLPLPPNPLKSRKVFTLKLSTQMTNRHLHPITHQRHRRPPPRPRLNQIHHPLFHQLFPPAFSYHSIPFHLVATEWMHMADPCLLPDGHHLISFTYTFAHLPPPPSTNEPPVQDFCNGLPSFHAPSRSPHQLLNSATTSHISPPHHGFQQP